MCVNDILAQGAEPLYFLDYLATGKNDPLRLENVVKGVADGCVQGNMALIGGEKQLKCLVCTQVMIMI